MSSEEIRPDLVSSATGLEVHYSLRYVRMLSHCVPSVPSRRKGIVEPVWLRFFDRAIDKTRPFDRTDFRSVVPGFHQEHLDASPALIDVSTRMFTAKECTLSRLSRTRVLTQKPRLSRFPELVH